MITLFDKIHGAEASAAIANSMGDVTEGMHYSEIEDQFGLLTELVAQEKKGGRHTHNNLGHEFEYYPHRRPPGMTEDGMERHRLAVTAIIEKGGRIDLEDLAKIWLRDIDPEKFGYLIGPQDRVIYLSLKAGVPPWETGRYATWPTLIGTSKMMIPIGLINACNPSQAAQDALELGRLKDVRGVSGNYALEVAAALAAGAAEAMKPEASVDSIIAVALDQLTSAPRAEVESGLEWAQQVDDWRELRGLYDEKYEGHAVSDAVEMLSSGLAILYTSNGNPEQAIIQAVNLGRDCDCRAYIAGGLSGALRGIDAVPKRWVDGVNAALPSDPYTVSRRLLHESAKGIYDAVLKNLAKIKEQVRQMESQVELNPA